MKELPTPAWFKNATGSRRFISKLLVDTTYAVMVGDLPNGMKHLWLTRHDGKPLLWAEKQKLKDIVAGEDAVAVEVYPAKADVLDTANIYHLWVFPEGFKLPFALEPEV